MAYSENFLRASAAATSNGNTPAQRLSGLCGYKPASLRIQLEVTAVAGTNPTLDVVIQDTLDGSNWNDVVTFTQATGATREVKSMAAPFADTIRIKHTIGGTAGPSATFSVVAAG